MASYIKLWWEQNKGKSFKALYNIGAYNDNYNDNYINKLDGLLPPAIKKDEVVIEIGPWNNNYPEDSMRRVQRFDGTIVVVSGFHPNDYPIYFILYED